MKKSTILTFAALGLILGSTPAHASLNVNGDLKTQIRIGSSTVQVPVRVISGTGTPVHATGTALAAEISESGHASMRVDGTELRGLANAQFRITSAAAVRTDADLEEYARAKAYGEASIDAIGSDESEVAVSFNRPAKLLGFIPVFMNEEATVSMESDGKATVKVDNSWWAFMAKNEDRSEAFAADIRTRIAPTVQNSLDASLSAAAKARILSGILASSEATYSTSAEVSASSK
jgi:hypothetical protein